MPRRATTPDLFDDGPHVVGSWLAGDADDAIRALQGAHAGCALLELRADLLTAAATADVVRAVERPLIVAVRRPQDGGSFAGSEEERGLILGAALDAGARFVDVEWQGAQSALADAPAVAGRVVLSHHGGRCRQPDLHALYEAMLRQGSGPLKIVPDAASPHELPAVAALLASARGSPRPLVAFAAGRAGAASRLLAPAWGSWATYGALASGAETAEGQFSVDDLLDVHDVSGIGPSTRLVLLVGNAVLGSPSPVMHAAAYRRAGLDARYLPLEVDQFDALDALLAHEPGPRVYGLAVTMPFKHEASRRCRALDATAREACAVNTVTFGVRGEWVGANTDGPAALELVARATDPRGLRTAIVGAGGTARAIACALRGAGATVTLFNRDSRRAARAAVALGVSAAPLERLTAAPWELLVNATPLGRSAERWFDPRRLCGRLVLDAVYGHEPTRLVADARERGLVAIDGLQLLATQAAGQFHVHTGRNVDVEFLLAEGTRWIGSRPA